MQFRYTIKDKTGKTITAMEESLDERSLIERLRKDGNIIISVVTETTKVEKKLESTAKGGGNIKLGELVLFSRQLATMIDAGIPLVQTLEILSEQVEHKGFKAIVGSVKESVSAGASFHEALAKHPRAFSPLFVQMAKAGETSGALDDIMERLALYLEKTDHLIRKVKSAMIYPMVVCSMAVLITLVMMIKVVPVFKSIFADFGGKLPLPTMVLITISDFLVKWFLLWLACAVVAFILFQKWVRTDKGVLAFDSFKLKMPVFGLLIRKVAVSKFTRTLATLVKSGVPILGALEIVGKTSGNKIIENAINKVRVSIREGETITEPLMKSKVFPPMVVRMISVGEQTGELEKMLTSYPHYPTIIWLAYSFSAATIVRLIPLRFLFF